MVKVNEGVLDLGLKVLASIILSEKGAAADSPVEAGAAAQAAAAKLGDKAFRQASARGLLGRRGGGGELVGGAGGWWAGSSRAVMSCAIVHNLQLTVLCWRLVWSRRGGCRSIRCTPQHNNGLVENIRYDHNDPLSNPLALASQRLQSQQAQQHALAADVLMLCVLGILNA